MNLSKRSVDKELFSGMLMEENTFITVIFYFLLYNKYIINI